MSLLGRLADLSVRQTIPSFPSNFSHVDMVETGLRLSKLLRDPAGPHKVDLIVCLTHSRVNNDIDLANSLSAVSGLGEDAPHGVDILLGGHEFVPSSSSLSRSAALTLS